MIYDIIILYGAAYLARRSVGVSLISSSSTDRMIVSGQSFLSVSLIPCYILPILSRLKSEL